MFMAVNSAIAAFGAANAGIGVAVATAGSVDAAANVAALNPALGLIGQDFLAAFTAAQAVHVESVAELAVLYGGIAASSSATVAAYGATEVANVAGLTSAVL
ncbi:hypothetical protein AXK60_13500 [Tsukamurella pseudospumae]|uniref:PE domain-containing protein n=2 Tax=Tsukamurella pseudospumae TaxID=239498 RepID=A0A138A407_9ACTN|nr:hypothetical protein [Tsukamurella pseudospumae]KXO96312.1 hypothetical protein AXK61_22615 [Tsukamurella pseudospumae]KXP05163.1 hypothetical protein AXK60_13500 [Tsukamurella pseudospumae]